MQILAISCMCQKILTVHSRIWRPCLCGICQNPNKFDENGASSINRALEKVCKQQLNRKWFEIYQTISCFGAFLLTLSLNKIVKLASKSVKLCTFIQIFIESIYVKLLSTLLEKIQTSPPSPSLTTGYHWYECNTVLYCYWRERKWYLVLHLELNIEHTKTLKYV